MAATGSQSLVGGQGQNSGAGQGGDNFKIDLGSPLWRHATRISQVAGGGSYIWSCNYCQSNKGKPFNSSYSHVKLHFMGSVGKGFGMCKGAMERGCLMQKNKKLLIIWLKDRKRVIINLLPQKRTKCIHLLKWNQLYLPNIHSCKFLYWERRMK